jgi:hypothetical protein
MMGRFLLMYIHKLDHRSFTLYQSVQGTRSPSIHPGWLDGDQSMPKRHEVRGWTTIGHLHNDLFQCTKSKAWGTVKNHLYIALYVKSAELNQMVEQLQKWIEQST